jgi:hypothetical protein
MTPGIALLCLSTDVVWSALVSPSVATLAAVAGVGALFAGVAWAFRRWFTLDGGTNGPGKRKKKEGDKAEKAGTPAQDSASTPVKSFPNTSV